MLNGLAARVEWFNNTQVGFSFLLHHLFLSNPSFISPTISLSAMAVFAHSSDIYRHCLCITPNGPLNLTFLLSLVPQWSTTSLRGQIGIRSPVAKFFWSNLNQQCSSKTGSTNLRSLPHDGSSTVPHTPPLPPSSYMMTPSVYDRRLKYYCRGIIRRSDGTWQEGHFGEEIITLVGTLSCPDSQFSLLQQWRGVPLGIPNGETSLVGGNLSFELPKSLSSTLNHPNASLSISAMPCQSRPQNTELWGRSRRAVSRC